VIRHGFSKAVFATALLVAFHPSPGGLPARHHAHRQRSAQTAEAPARQLPPTATGITDIPPAYLALYRSSVGQCPGMPWQLLAGVGRQETSHGRSPLPGVHSGLNSYVGTDGRVHHCCGGPMQFKLTAPSTWAVYGRGGNPYDPRDAVPAAARKLCADGANRPGGSLAQAAALYFGGGLRDPASYRYAMSVLGWARSYGLKEA